MNNGDNSCARTRGWNWDYTKLQRLESKSSSSDEDMSFNFDDSDKSEQSSDGGYGSEPPAKESINLGKDLSGLNVSSSAQALRGNTLADKEDLAALDTEDEEIHVEHAAHEAHISGEALNDSREKSGKHKDEHRRREKDHEKRSKRKDKSKEKHSSMKESKRRKDDLDDKKSHDRQRRSEKSDKWEREDDGDLYKREKHRERGDDRKEKHRGDDYSDHDSHRRDRHWDSSRSSHHKGFAKGDREKDVKRTRLDGEQRASYRTRSPSRSPRRSSSPHYNDEEKDWSSKEKEGSSRYRRSGLGGYSPRRRRSDAAIRTPSPPSRSPERKKTRAWDLPPVGMDSGVAAAMAAAHQAAAQQAAALASVSSLVTVNPALAAVSLTQATRNFRRLYIGNVPASVSDGELLEFINAAMLSVNANHLPGTKPCINCMVNVEKSYAFAEFLTPEDATAGLAFDGITLHGTTLKIRRPRDYVPPPNGGVGIASVMGMVSSVVPDSPQKVFVGGICKTLTAEKVKEIVTAFGQLKAYHWEITVKNNQLEAYAFLEYLDPSVTLKACAGLNGMRLGNKTITVVQATPNASTEPDAKQVPFYGVPEHAKTLLQAPTRILELQNVITKEEALSMSEAEFLEIEEDVRIECKRFGTVKSTHIVKPEVKPDENTPINTGDGNTGGQLVLPAGETYLTEVDKKIADYIASFGGQCVPPGANCTGRTEVSQAQASQMSDALVREVEVPRSELPEGGAIAEASWWSEKPAAGEVNSENTESQHAIEPPATEAAQPGMDIDETNVDMKDQGTTLLNTEISGQVAEDIGAQNATPCDANQSVAEDSDLQSITAASSQLVAVTPSDLDMAEAAADAVESLNTQISESDIGRVYVEFTREECASMAAHALHGRVYANRPVIAGYFPLKMYQKKFKKGLEPRTHEERQLLALAAQEHLNSFIPDRE